MENLQTVRQASDAIKAFFTDESRRTLLNRSGIEKAAGLAPRRITTLENYNSHLTEDEINALMPIIEKLQLLPPTMKIDKMCEDPAYDVCFEIFCSDYPQGVRCPYDADALHSCEQIWPMSEYFEDEDIMEGEEPQHPFWSTNLMDILNHYQDVRIRVVRNRLELEGLPENKIRVGSEVLRII